MTPNFVVWRVICYLSGFCWSQYITTESWQFTNLVLILIVHTTECLCPVSGILVSWYPCPCPRLSEDQSWLSRSRSGTCLLAPVVTPGHWHTGPSLVSSRPLIGHLASPLASDWSDLAHCLTGFVVVSPCLWVTLWSALGPASPARCLPQYQEWESRLRRERRNITIWEIHLDNAAPRLGQHQTLRSQGEADNTIYGSGVLCGSGSEKLWILDHREEEHSISSFQDDYELSKSWNRSLKQTKKLSSFLSLHLQFGTDEK